MWHDIAAKTESKRAYMRCLLRTGLSAVYGKAHQMSWVAVCNIVHSGSTD